ncbi:MAG TPA: histone deacetylase [Calditrichia bacterium]|nr:histone deacetylase [Calditrichota bacterium]HQV30554.1 histone deacetylase [Calditrichia bacterium]
MKWFRRRHFQIVYRFEYLSAAQDFSEDKGFGIMKFKKIRDRLREEKVVRRRDWLSPERLGDEDLLLVHTPAYLDSLKDPAVVARELFLTQYHPWDNEVFEYFRYVGGGTCLALEKSLQSGNTIFNMGGGFHHAQPDRAEGYCLINDVAVAIEKIRRSGHRPKILIVDLDFHQGNGNTLYFEGDPTVFTFSIHNDSWVHIDDPTNLDITLPENTDDNTYLKVLNVNLESVMDSFQPQAVIYLAGSDPHIHDPHGTFNITEAGLLKRDLTVYNMVQKRKLPLVVLAAGGYGAHSWRFYYNFIRHVVLHGKRGWL